MEIPNPSGFCMCGCGQKTNISDVTRPDRNLLAGHHKMYIAGHQNRKLPAERFEYEPNQNGGYCHCGCGQLTSIATASKPDRDQIKGKHVRYCEGHGSLKSYQMYQIEDWGYVTPCWIWLRGLSSTGYGAWVDEDEKTRSAHRVMYEKENGLIPQGYVIDHLCNIRPCVNPSHLEAVTPGENTRRHWIRYAQEEREFKTRPTGICIEASISSPIDDIESKDGFATMVRIKYELEEGESYSRSALESFVGKQTKELGESLRSMISCRGLDE